MEMAAIRVRVTADVDGELHLAALPMHKGEAAEVIVLTGDSDHELTLAVLENDPAWQWLHDPAEDIYTGETNHGRERAGGPAVLGGLESRGRGGGSGLFR